MKNVTLTTILLFTVFTSLIAQDQNVKRDQELIIQRDQALIKKVIQEAYVEGIFLRGDAELLKKGWHPECDIVIFENGGITKLPAKYWIDRLEKKPIPLDPSVTYNFTDVQVTGYAAIAVIEIFSDGKQIYTDYMCLYKFTDGWKIVTKIYYAFPK
ncbi:MAG: nuclear transport factor 2 family protein [Bacteroidetes bacterium]|jgi:hypothetical protein|nr:nuclear transport factor 2 family protein [Bacteroidota bacterium]